MKIKPILVFSLLITSSCSINNTVFHYNNTLQPNNYKLDNEKPIALELDYSAVNSLRPIYQTNELLVDTWAGAEFLDKMGNHLAVYNKKSNEITSPVTELMASKAIGDNLILSYVDHLAILDIHSMQVLSKLENPANVEGSNIASISPNGRYAIAFGYLWNITAKQKLNFYNPNEFFKSASNSADFSPDNKYFVVSANLLTDSRAQLWDLNDGKLKHSWREPGISHVVLSSDSKVIIFVIEKQIDYMWKGDTQILAYDIETGSQLGTLNFSSRLTINPIDINGKQVITGHENGDIHIWSYRDFTAEHSYHGQTAVTSVNIDEKGRIWCGFYDGTLLVIENGQFSLVHTFKSRIVHLAVLGDRLFVELFSQPGNHLASYDILNIDK